MTSTSGRARRGITRSVLVGVAGACAIVLASLDGAGPAAAATQTEQGSIPLSSSSSTGQVVLDQFDPADGTLQGVTVTVTVAGAASVEVTNLTSAAKATTVTVEPEASVSGPGLNGLAASGTDTQSQNLAASATFAFAVDAAGTDQRVLTAAGDLSAFVGTGTVSFDVTGRVGVDVEGPATWRSAGELSGTATVQVAYSFNRPPNAVADSATVLEDSGASAIDVLANDTDVDGGDMVIGAVTQPTNGAVVITGGGTAVTYEPDPGYCNTPPGSAVDTFTYTLTPGASTATVSVTVTCVVDAPVAVGDGATVAEDSAATAIDVLANDSDPDLVGMDIAAATDPANGTVVLTGGSPGAHTGLTYEPDPDYCNNPPGTTPDTFTYTLAPGADTATVSVTVTCVDDPTVAVDDSATVPEDAGASAISVLANDIDIDGDPLSIDSVTQPANGTVVLTGGGSGLTYAPDANYCNDPPGTTLDTFTYTVDGSTATVSVAVTCADDPPTAVDDSATVDQDSAPTAVDVLANDTDGDGGPKTIESVTQPAHGAVVITGGGTGLTYAPEAGYCNDPPGAAPDTFTYTLNFGSTATVSVLVDCDAPPVAVSDTATVSEDAVAAAVDVLVNDTDGDGGPKTIESVTQPANGAVVITGAGAGLTYQPNANYCNDPPGTTPDTFTYSLNGGSTATVSVTVTCVDDAPTAVADSATIGEDSGASAVDVLANDTDVDGGPKLVVSASDPANGTVVITGGGSGLTYQPDANYCNDPPGTAPDTFTYTLGGGSTATVSITVTCVNDAPVADDETFDGSSSAIGNTTLVVNDLDDGAPATPDPTDTAPVTSRPHKAISGDILAGDADVDGPGPLTVTAGTFTTNDGGSVTIQSDGDFVFEPVPATSCTDASDFFDYTLNDGGSPNQTDTGRVTIAITGCVWYVNNDDAGGNAGTAQQPFDTLAQAESASAAGHSIFVYDGNNTTSGYAAGITLKADQQLIGEAAALAVGVDTLHTADPANRPTITDTNADVVELDDANTVRGLAIDPQGTGGGIAGASGDTGGGTIGDVTIIDTGTAGTQPGLELDATTGTFDISNLTVSTNGAIGVRLNNAGTVNFAASGTISITTAGARGLDAAGATTSFGTSTIDDITVTGSASGGVVLAATTGTLTLGDGVGTDLSLTTTSGSTAAFSSTHTGTLTVDAAGTDNISATGGPAVDVTGSGSFAFDDVDSTNSTGDGINLDGLGTGTFSATSGDITGAAGIAFDLNGGSGTITYPGNLNNGTGATADITGRSGGSVTLSGPIGDSNDAGGGITLSGNIAGSTTFSNAAKVINSGATNAVSMTASNGHTLTLSGGGLDIDTTSGRGINADDSGTVNVTGTGNTITATTGIALNVAGTDIGGSGLTFQSISANGATSGIVLNTTGSGGLTVTGTGSAGTGGTIQSATGDGVSLTSSGPVNLSHMNVAASADDGIDGTNVAGLVLTGVSLTDNGNAANEEGISLVNVSGAVTLTGTSVTGSGYNNLRIDNTSGTVSTLALTNSSFSGNDAVTGNHGVLVEMRGTSVLTSASVTGSTLANNRVMGIQVATADTATVGSFTVSASTISGNELGVDFSKAQQSSLTFSILNNTAFTGQNSHGINVFSAVGAGTTGTLRGRIQGNTIGNAAVDGSGSAIGNCIRVNINGDTDADIVIDSNVVRECPNGRGIEVVGRNGTGGLDVTVTNNDVDHVNLGFSPGTSDFPLAGILVQSNCATVCNTVRADVRGNIVLAGATFDLLPTHLALVETSTSTLQLVDTAPANADCASHLASANTGSVGASAGCALIAGPINTPP